MSETPQSPQGDKARRPRPFGGFLLFLTVLVVVLFAFGSNHWKGDRIWTEDRFWWELHTGTIGTIKLKGENEVVGKTRTGDDFETSLADMKAREHEIQQELAKGVPVKLDHTTFDAIVSAGLFSPRRTGTSSSTTPRRSRASRARKRAASRSRPRSSKRTA